MRIIILGPTAVGKTSASIKLAQRFDTSIISVDSRQCYKYLNIGTATPPLHELSQVNHYNISVLNPDENDSAIQFHKRAQEWEQHILAEHSHVIYDGGSTLHLQSLIVPFDPVPKADKENVNQLEQEAQNNGLDRLYDRLKTVDPEYADQMDGLNRQRIIRALDVWMQTGQPFSSFHTNWEEYTLPDDTIVFGLHRPRKQLHQRINRRTDLMMQRGFLREVQSILAMGYTPNLQSLNTVGYRHLIQFLRGEITLDDAVKDIKTHTRRYAKRQITWFRRWDFIHWLNANKHDDNTLVNLMQEKLAAKQNNI